MKMKSDKNMKKSKKQSMSYEQQREYETKRTVKILSVILLIVMGLSVFGFSMIGTGANVGTNQDSQNIPFTQNLFQDSQSGETYSGAVIDGTQFIFYEDVSEYENNQELIELSQSLQSYNGSAVYEYVDEGYTNDDARILIAQALRANNINLLSTNEINCEQQPTLIFTHNQSSITQDTQSCMVFDANVTQTFSLSNGLAYHLIKDLQ